MVDDKANTNRTNQTNNGYCHLQEKDSSDSVDSCSKKQKACVFDDKANTNLTNRTNRLRIEKIRQIR